MTVFGSFSFVPPAIVGEKVSEPALHGIKGMLEERQIPERQLGGREAWNRWFGGCGLIHPHSLQQHCENQSASVVVGGVALSAVRDCEDRVLQHTSVIAE